MKTLSRLLCLTLLSVALGCSAASRLIDFEQAEGSDWSSFRTFSWDPRPGDHGPGPVIRSVVESRMASHGYVLATGDGDIRVSVDAGIQGTQSTSTKLWSWDGPHDAQSGSLRMIVRDGDSSRQIWSAKTKRMWRADMEEEELEAMLLETMNNFMDRIPRNQEVD